MIRAWNGKLGHGKSYSQLRETLRFANERNLDVVTNVPDINLDVLGDYCERNRYHRMAAKIRRGYWFIERDFNNLMYYSGAVIMADELGIFMNARGTLGQGYERHKPFFEGLVLSRKAELHLFWVAQDLGMVDLNVRRLTDFYTHCVSTDPSKDPWSPHRFCVAADYMSYDYEKYLESRGFNAWRRWAIATKVYRFDSLLMKAYNTLSRMDGSVVTRCADVAAELVGDGQYLEPTKNPVPLVVPAGFDLQKVKPVVAAKPLRERFKGLALAKPSRVDPACVCAACQGWAR